MMIRRKPSSLKASGTNSGICKRGTNSLRRGITLYEVLLSLVIFSGALLALGQSIDIGSRASTQAQLGSQATIFCQSLLAEVQAGEIPMEAASSVPIMEGDKDWLYDLDIEETQVEGILLLRLTVYNDENTTGANVESSISRLVRDPESLLTETETDDGEEQ